MHHVVAIHARPARNRFTGYGGESPLASRGIAGHRGLAGMRTVVAFLAHEWRA